MIGEALRRRRHRGAYSPDVIDIDWAKLPYNRIAVVNLLLAAAGGGDYLEIGCDADLLFKAVMAARKIGVDPRQGGTDRQTSDAWFEENPGARFDVVFIDGLHTYTQVHRDLANALKAGRPGGFVALHDMLPRDWIEEHTPMISSSRWTGDGWKCAFELMATPGVDFRLFALDHGVGVVRVLEEQPALADLGEDLANERFAYFHRRYGELPVVDFETGRDWVEGKR